MSERQQSPKRQGKSPKTVALGREIAAAWEALGVTPGQVHRLTGMNQERLRRMREEGEDAEAPPKIHNLILYALYRLPELRTLTGDIPVPWDKLGITTIKNEEI